MTPERGDGVNERTLDVLKNEMRAVKSNAKLDIKDALYRYGCAASRELSSMR